MKIYFGILILVFIPLSLSFSQEERNVLAEIFTNSHCGNCPAAHNTINNYLSTSPNADRITVIYYHMIYPYSDDPLYLHNTIDSDGRDDYYNPIQATPRGFFDGQSQGSVSTWQSSLNNLVMTESPLKINLSGVKMDGSFSIKAEVIRSGNIPENDLAVHFVVLENLNYTGRNGISHHKNVMRKMVDGAFGSPFSIDINETKDVEKDITLHPDWVKDSLKVAVFVQSDAGKTVYQSAIINFSELNEPTGIGSEASVPETFILNQNYPNPFNPSTKISYQIPEESFVSLTVYNILGKEVTSLVRQKQQAGMYEISFNAGILSSGIYIYKLTAVNSSGRKNVQTRKMTFLQ